MAKIANPIDLGKTGIDLLPTIEKLLPAYGRINDSGLFKREALATNVAIWKVIENENPRMTKLTSFTERDAVKVGRKQEKHVTVGGFTLKKTGGVHVEDLMNVYTGTALSLENETLQSKIADRTQQMYETLAQEREWLLLTTTQGRTKDLDGVGIVTDLFAATGTTQTTLTIDARPASTTLISGLRQIQNAVAELNGYHGVLREVEVVVAQDVFDALSVHPEFVAAVQIAYTGRGQEALNNPQFTGQAVQSNLTRYGWRDELRWQNLLITTYRQTFRTLTDVTVSAVANGKGWTIAHGATDCYGLGFSPAPYFSTYNRGGQEIYARSTGIIDDTHVDVTIESHLMPHMKRPELALDLTFTLA